MGLISSLKGLIGETFGSIAHKVMLDRDVYRELNNVTIPTPDGTTMNNRYTHAPSISAIRKSIAAQ